MGLEAGAFRAVQQMLRPIANRLANSIARGVVQLVNDGKKMQLVQLRVLEGEDVEGEGGAEHFQPYGFSSVPLAGAEHVTLFPNGDRSHPLVVCIADRRHRPIGGESGEVTVYSETGAKVRLLASGDIEVCPAPGGVVRVGGSGASEAPALSAELADLKSRIANWTPVANDGGASLKELVFADWAVPGAAKVKVE